MTRIIVVSDLDGTLLNHHDYGFEAARPALAELRRRAIPLVLNSSKTASEIAELRRALDNSEPYVVENGAGIHLPDGRTLVLGKARAEVLAQAQALRARDGYRFRGFADLTAEALAELTGLSAAAAQLALQREFTEPLLWEDEPERLQAFLTSLAGVGISALRGGRFLHLGGGADKGKALDWLRGHYWRQFGERPYVIALGDSDNDLAMLRQADQAVLVRSPVRYLEFEQPGLLRTQEEGPAGWNRALLDLLQRCDGLSRE